MYKLTRLEKTVENNQVKEIFCNIEITDETGWYNYGW